MKVLKEIQSKKGRQNIMGLKGNSYGRSEEGKVREEEVKGMHVMYSMLHKAQGKNGREREEEGR